MTETTPSKIERAKAPIKTTLVLKYSHITVTIDMNDAYGQVRGFEIVGKILEGGQPSIPEIKFNKSVVCPRCKEESTLSMIDNIGVECPFCHMTLRREVEI